jgi:predicted O-methyltransferase YrrM
MNRSLLPEAVERYVCDTITHETAVQRRLRDETARLPNAGMQIGSDLGRLLALLVRAINARRALEIGTYTGYSALAVATALPADGLLVACDVNAEWTAIGRRHWEEAGVAARIDLRLGPAIETLKELRKSLGAGAFDFAFIDADKSGYDSYYEACLELVRPNGLIALDNMLWSGKVADPAADDDTTVAIRTLNAKIAADPRVDAALLTLGDGVMLARRR